MSANILYYTNGGGDYTWENPSNWNTAADGSGTTPDNAPWHNGDTTYSDWDLYDATNGQTIYINANDIGYGAIYGKCYIGNIIANNSSIIIGGNWYGNLSSAYYIDGNAYYSINGGTFYGTVDLNLGTINSGDFLGSVFTAVINGGTFESSASVGMIVVNGYGGQITGGTFYCDLAGVPNISGGYFYGNIDTYSSTYGYGLISGGIFESTSTVNIGATTVSGGDFYTTAIYTSSGGGISGGNFWNITQFTSNGGTDFYEISGGNFPSLTSLGAVDHVTGGNFKNGTFPTGGNGAVFGRYFGSFISYYGCIFDYGTGLYLLLYNSDVIGNLTGGCALQHYTDGVADSFTGFDYDYGDGGYYGYNNGIALYGSYGVSYGGIGSTHYHSETSGNDGYTGADIDWTNGTTLSQSGTIYINGTEFTCLVGAWDGVLYNTGGGGYWSGSTTGIFHEYDGGYGQGSIYSAFYNGVELSDASACLSNGITSGGIQGVHYTLGSDCYTVTGDNFTGLDYDYNNFTCGNDNAQYLYVNGVWYTGKYQGDCYDGGLPAMSPPDCFGVCGGDADYGDGYYYTGCFSPSNEYGYDSNYATDNNGNHCDGSSLGCDNICGGGANDVCGVCSGGCSSYCGDCGNSACVSGAGGSYGCTNSSYCNYNPSATCDDGSCSGYYGCTQQGYCNYDPSAGCDDGSCSGSYQQDFFGNYCCSTSIGTDYFGNSLCDGYYPACSNIFGACGEYSGGCLYPDCTGVCNGESVVDHFGICNGNAQLDCNGNWYSYPCETNTLLNNILAYWNFNDSSWSDSTAGSNTWSLIHI